MPFGAAAAAALPFTGEVFEPLLAGIFFFWGLSVHSPAADGVLSPVEGCVLRLRVRREVVGSVAFSLAGGVFLGLPLPLLAGSVSSSTAGVADVSFLRREYDAFTFGCFFANDAFPDVAAFDFAAAFLDGLGDLVDLALGLALADAAASFWTFFADGPGSLEDLRSGVLSRALALLVAFLLLLGLGSSRAMVTYAGTIDE